MARSTMSKPENDADVIVVGAGPGGSATAAHLARAGIKTLLLEKTEFPREKVCGDGLTPRAVKELLALDIDLTTRGWIKNKGLRIIGGGHRLELPWPELSVFPDYGLVRTRADLDQILAQKAAALGADLHESTSVTGPVMEQDRIVGVTTKNAAGEERTYRAPIVVAADGNSSRLSLAMGLTKRDDRPLGVAVRTYFRSPRHEDDWLESWLELWDQDRLLPGYGWVFGVGDGTSNVGLGILNSSPAFANVDYRALLMRWAASMPKEWGYVPEEMVGPIRGAALPMGFNRTPHFHRGMLLVGDAGGMVNPFNGEGIAYAMESGRIAAEIIAEAVATGSERARDVRLATYPTRLKSEWGGYYTLGRVFVKLIGNDRVMKVATQKGLAHPTLMKFTLKLLANLSEPKGGDVADRLISALTRIAPAA
ncbi:MAG: geranylgeranyl reductase family protein [Actinobacteria bacterium]|nr:geranylgeranyl reductase family protein [Actinomycetota bacterium]MSY51108.1 geranylgeranyl reductase family protein [Actinomycetota bacterium]MSY87122.1 geranylgeranyl reductase family protein [Actinomycetota bacterium]MTA51140.1 geranylgeranyl reductase family protein [Actinomycetota bacterium]